MLWKLWQKNNWILKGKFLRSDCCISRMWSVKFWLVTTTAATADQKYSACSSTSALDVQFANNLRAKGEVISRTQNDVTFFWQSLLYNRTRTKSQQSTSVPMTARKVVEKSLEKKKIFEKLWTYLHWLKSMYHDNCIRWYN